VSKVWERIEPDQPLQVTRESLREIQEHSVTTLGLWENERVILARLTAIVGRPVRLVEEIVDSEESVFVALRERQNKSDYLGKCQRCGHRVFHRLRVPPKVTTLCVPCWEGLAAER
jgi:DNA-directed RNA polymerase subunit RPC12/RpoP